MKKYREIGKHWVVDPEVCFGRLTVKGTRVPVEIVLHGLAQGGTIDYVMRNWPRVSREAVEEILHLAAEALVRICKARPFYRRPRSLALLNGRSRARRNSRAKASK